jgi:protein-disulfide isomerase
MPAATSGDRPRPGSRYAAELGVDLQAVDTRAIADRLDVDVASAIASGARGTPTLFINGRLHADGYDQRVLGPALERAGAAAATNGGS